MRTLITGGTGFIGRRVVALGIERGLEIHVASRSPGAQENAHTWVCDLTDAETVSHVVESVQPDTILHLAAGGVAYGTGTLGGLLRANAEGLAHLLESAARCPQAPHVVIAGSGFEYATQDRAHHEDDPLVPTGAYAVSKAAAALVARHHAGRMPITLLRLFGAYGPGEKEPRLAPHVIAQARKRAPVLLTGCLQQRDYTYVDDIAEGFWRVAALPPEDGNLRTLNLASGRVVSLRQFVETLAQVLERRNQAPELRFGVMPYRVGDPMHYSADISRLRALLGWSPPTDLADGLARQVEATP